MSKRRATAPGQSRRDRLRAEQERAAREKRVRTRVTLGVVGVVLLVAVGLVAFVVVRSGGSAEQPTAGSTPTGEAIDGYALVAGSADAPVVVDVYQDYLCPYCGQFERANRDDLQAMVADGTMRLRLHPMNFLDPQSGGSRYSTRAANAVVTVAESEPDKLLAVNAALYDQQPKEGTTGLSDEQIAGVARSTGVSESTIEKFAAGTYESFVDAADQAAFADGVQSTPTVQINGQPFEGDLYTAGALRTAVEAAAQSAR